MILPRVIAGLSCRRFSLRIPIVVLVLHFLLAACHGAASATSPNDAVSKRYRLAIASYHNLLSHNELQKERKQWDARINAFKQIYERHSSSDVGPSCLYMIGSIHRQLYYLFGNPLDLVEAIWNFEKIVKGFPDDALADNALYNLGDIYVVEKNDVKSASASFTRITSSYKKGDMAAAAASRLAELSGGASANDDGKTRENNVPQPLVAPDTPAAVVDLRHGSTNYYSRLIIEMSHPVQFEEIVLEGTEGQPRRLCVNLQSSTIPKQFTKTIPIDDGLLKQVKSSQYSEDVVRVVLDTQSSITSHKISAMENPFRIVIDVWGEEEAKIAVQQPRKQLKEKAVHSLPQQLGLTARRIIIDAGHGGKDPGALGPDGMEEKDITLKVAKLLAAHLEKDNAHEVVMTRDRDRYLSLEKRTEIANASKGDIFISLHVNSAPNPQAKGVETYFLSLATNNEEMRAAARENASANRQLSDLQAILKDLLHNTKVNESAKLAERVQERMVSGLNSKYGGIMNLGVKKAPFIVLIGAQMPAALVEIAFLSNHEEAKRLREDAYLEAVANQISAGVANYVKELNKMASFR